MKNYLVHHGIVGMRWGVRRYQNEDGSLTEAGKKRYGKEYEDSKKRDKLTRRDPVYTHEAYSRRAQFRADRDRFWADQYDKEANHSNNDKEYQNESRDLARLYREKAEKHDAKARAYQRLSEDRRNYDRHTSTGRLRAQNILLGDAGAEFYRDARARGDSRARAFVDSMFGVLTANPRNVRVYTAAEHSRHDDSDR